MSAEQFLPELPEVGYLGDDVSYGYDSTDMRDYALEAVRAALASQATPTPGAPGQEAAALKPCRHGHIRCLVCMNNRGKPPEAAAVQAVGAEPTPEMVKRMVLAWLSQPPGLPWDDCAIAAWKAGVAALPPSGAGERS